MKKNGFTMVELIAIIVIMVLMILIIFPSITSTISKSEQKQKQEELNNIYMAAEDYLMFNYDNYEYMDIVGNTAYIYVLDLINQKYIDINQTNPIDGQDFNAKDVVKIIRNEDRTFKYELTKVNSLIEILLKQYQEGATTGLLKDSDNPNLYYYKGTNEQVANNFLWYGGHQWRVLEFDTNENTVTLISQQPLTAIQPASSSWTTEEEYTSSYINSWLNDYFWNSLDGSIQNNIKDNTFNVGIPHNVSEITTVQKVGLLDEEQYRKVGNKDSFLDIKDVFLLGSSYTLFARYVDYDGNIDNNSVLYTYGIRPVIKIYDLVNIIGDGTLTNNYRIEKNITNMNNAQVGEYINLPYKGTDNACGSDKICTFRIVSKNNGNIKIILNGLLLDLSTWGNSKYDDNMTTDNIIYTPLKSFVGYIDEKYITMGSFGVGMYKYGDSYTIAQESKIKFNVGIPTIGEIFSGNDIDMSVFYPKTFVDVNTIENPVVSDGYWTMNRSSSGYAHSITKNGYSFYEVIENESSIRPVIFLKDNLKFTGGDGTAQNPYTVD